MVYDYYLHPDSKQNPVAAIANTISGQVVLIRNAKEKKKGERAGKGNIGKAGKSKGHGSVEDLGDANINDLDKVPQHIIDELGGEDFTQEVKKEMGGKKSDLYWDREGNVYAVLKKGGTPPQWIITVPR